MYYDSRVCAAFSTTTAGAHFKANHVYVKLLRIELADRHDLTRVFSSSSRTCDIFYNYLQGSVEDIENCDF